MNKNVQEETFILCGKLKIIYLTMKMLVAYMPAVLLVVFVSVTVL